MTGHQTETEFYATDLFDEEVDFSIVEDLPVLETVRDAAQSAADWVVRAVAAGAIAATLSLSLPFIPAFVTVPPEARAAAAARAAVVDTMTARMTARAGLASRLFQRTPHPGADEADPDYGF
jgi:hypothetical protein